MKTGALNVLWEFTAAEALALVPEGGAVSPRRIAPPTLAGVHIFPGHLSIRPDSPCHQLMEHDFGPLEEAISLV